MQIGSRFTIAVHVIAAIEYFKDADRVNSAFLAGSIGVNPVIVRTVISQLREAGILQTRRGSSGAATAKRLEEITLYDVYRAVGSVDAEEGLFHFHEQPNPDCPVGRNIRADDSFVEDEGWHTASAAYADFLRRHEGLHTLYLEIGVGGNTPVIIKYPFWAMTAENPKAVYACVNFTEAFCPKQIEERSLCIDGDAGAVLDRLS